MLVEYFKQYIKIARGVSDSTVKHYITAINTINTLLSKYNLPTSDVFSVKSLLELNAVKTFLEQNEEFIQKDTVGNRMYSVAFNHFYRFSCEDHDFYKTKIDKMDIKIPKLKVVENVHYTRNQIISAHAIEAANYQCENHAEHKTFTSASTNKPFMEGHHLIPMKKQSEFDVSLDVYANIICLCPICHRLLHYGIASEKEYLADKLFENRQSRLIHSGIDISRNAFKQLISL